MTSERLVGFRQGLADALQQPLGGANALHLAQAAPFMLMNPALPKCRKNAMYNTFHAAPMQFPSSTRTWRIAMSSTRGDRTMVK